MFFNIILKEIKISGNMLHLTKRSETERERESVCVREFE
jgi:hypothetical protein